MRKKMIVGLAFFLAVCLLFAACGKKEAPAGNETGSQTGNNTEIQVETRKFGNITLGIIDPAKLSDSDLLSWYEASYKEQFSHTVSHIDGYKYVLISAGEVPTAGYSITLLDAKIDNDILVVYAALVSPKAGEQVAQALTYPHILFRLPDKEAATVRVDLDMGSIAVTPPDSQPAEAKPLTGVFVGLADANSVEIIIGGTPATFFLSESLKAELEKKEIAEGTKVEIKFNTETGMQILQEIKPIP
ncbi:MAG: protease complex subunit PrcB family protein [Clostridia bacterium]|jgi:hypothetical protein|nr:protease complex subunit PrcB family protein [Clostridia bacterium]